MADTISVHKAMGSLDVAPQFDGFSKVIIHTSDTDTGQAGNDTGRTLEFDNPYADGQEVSRNAIAKDILNRLQTNGLQYQPYTADDAIINPAAEIGDAISSPLVFGGIYTRTKTFGHLMLTNASAPHDEEINHEYQYESPEVREFKRQNDLLRASLTVTNSAITSEVERAQGAESNLASSIEQKASDITASVVANEGGTQSNFGWKLTADGFYLFSKNKTVLTCTKDDGLVVDGNVSATTGTIGDFTIKGGALFTNKMETMQSTQSTGVHLSKNGLKIGQNVSITNNGIITANSMKLKGTITFLNANGSTAGTLSAANLRTAAQSTLDNGGNWSSAYSSACTSGGYCHDGVADYNDHFGYSELAGGWCFKHQQFMAPEVIANSGLRGNIYCTDVYGNNGKYRAPYYKTMNLLTGGSISYQEVWSGYSTYTFSGTYTGNINFLCVGS